MLNWQLALGNDESNLSARKITKSIKIKAGETLYLFSGNGLRFSLNNSGGIVELRYPDGRRADQVEYSKEKIGEDEEFVLVGERWIWQDGAQNTSEDKSSLQKEVDKSGASINSEKIWHWWKVTQNEIEKVCESSEKLSFDNWKSRNSAYLKFLKFKNKN